ncbi:hypothetical protein ACMHYB_59885 [Sorangium sp. So ce1128]
MTDWKYCLPHIWDHPRQVWEDVYLLPDDPGYAGPGLHLTVDAFGNALDPSHGSDRAEFQAEALAQLGDAEFRINGSEMLLRQEDFSREELLSWVRVWLAHNGFPVGQLREVPAEEFAGRVKHASIITALTASYSDLDK